MNIGSDKQTLRCPKELLCDPTSSTRDIPNPYLNGSLVSIIVKLETSS